MDNQKAELDFEYQNSQYGSIDNAKPLIYQKSYTSSIQSQPVSEVKYESLNEIHLDFSKATPFQNGHRSIGSNSSLKSFGTKNVILPSLSDSPKQKTNISSNIPPIDTNANTLNKTSFFAPSTDTTLDSPFQAKNTPISTDTPLSAVNLFKSILSPINKNQQSDIQEREIPFDYQDTTIDTFVDDQRDEFENINPNISILSSSSFDSKSQTPNFRSFKTFERLRDQLAQEQIKNETQNQHSREQIIHNQFSEQFKNEFTRSSSRSSTLKRENAFVFTKEKDDPFNPYNNSNVKPSQEVNDKNNDDPFTSSTSNEPPRKKFLKINWTIQTESEKYISRLESKIKKIKKTPKEIVVEIPNDDFDDNYAYDSVNEESELLSDSDSINQPLISRSDAGARLRRRKHIMQTFRDNKKLIIIVTILAILLLTASVILYL